MATEKRLYKITFQSQGQVYEVFAKRVNQGGLLGFVEIEQLVFGARNRVVVDPSEEQLEREFAGVKRFFLPMHSIIRIDEVEKQGQSRIAPAEKGSVTPFPVPMFKPGQRSSD